MVVKREIFASHPYLSPPQGWPRRKFVKMFDADKTGMIGLPYGEKSYHNMPFSSITGTSRTDGQTDRQTDGQSDRYAISISLRHFDITDQKCFNLNKISEMICVSIFLIKPQRQNFCVCNKAPAEVSCRSSPTTRHSTVYAALWTEKLNLLNKQCFYRNNKLFYTINSYNTSSNAVFRYWHSPTVVLLLCRVPMLRCSKSAQKSAVYVCQVATVVMETRQLVLSQFNKKLSCRRETAWRFVSLNILPTHSRSLKVIRNDTVE